MSTEFGRLCENIFSAPISGRKKARSSRAERSVMKKTTAEARATQIGSDRQFMLAEIERRQAAHAAMFTMPWSEDQLSDSGWFSLVAVPWLLQQVEDNGKSDGKNGNANCDPGSNGVGTPKPAVEFVLAEKAVADAAVVVPLGNPLAKFLVCFLAKLVGVSFVLHGWRTTKASRFLDQYLKSQASFISGLRTQKGER